MLSQSELDAIRSRAEAATDGEWDIIDDYDGVTSYYGWRGISCQSGHGGHGGDGLVFATHEWDVGLREADAQFIAHARTDVPALLDAIAETRAELVKHFDDIDVDYEGEPNELDTMVRQAAGQLHESRSWSSKEAERANVAEHKNSQLRSRFALELASRTTPDMAESQRQANRITELEDVGKDNQYIVETLARALRVDLGAHCITELAHAAADMIEKLRGVNGGLRKWQDISRPKLEARIAELEAAHVPRDMADALKDGEHILMFTDKWHIGGWAFGSWQIAEADGRLSKPVCTPTHWLPLPDHQSGGG